MICSSDNLDAFINICEDESVKVPAYIRRSIDFKYLWTDILACFTPSNADEEIPKDAFKSIIGKNIEMSDKMTRKLKNIKYKMGEKTTPDMLQDFFYPCKALNNFPNLLLKLIASGLALSQSMITETKSKNLPNLK